MKVWRTFSFAATELSCGGMCALKVTSPRKLLFSILKHVMHNELIFLFEESANFKFYDVIIDIT